MDFLIDLHSHGHSVNSGQDILWADAAFLQSACPFLYFYIEVSRGTFAAVSITVMLPLEAKCGLASVRLTSHSHPWRLDGFEHLRVMELANLRRSLMGGQVQRPFILVNNRSSGALYEKCSCPAHLRSP